MIAPVPIAGLLFAAEALAVGLGDGVGAVLGEASGGLSKDGLGLVGKVSGPDGVGTAFGSCRRTKPDRCIFLFPREPYSIIQEDMRQSIDKMKAGEEWLL